MPVDRCICHNLLFRDLHAIAAAEHWTLADFDKLSARTRCSTSCAMCRPYIQVMLATGRTELPIMSEEECRRLAATPPPNTEPPR